MSRVQARSLSSRTPRLGDRPLAEVAAKLKTPKLPPSLRMELQKIGKASPALAVKAARAPTRNQRLIQRSTFGWTTSEQAAINQLGYDAYLERQLDYESIDDSPLEDILHDAFPTLAMSSWEIFDGYFEDEPEVPIFELILATLFRATYSPRQLYERMVTFWSDHFSINLLGDFGNVLKPVDDREIVRRHALGKFPDLLKASAYSPAMLVYLTNDTNVKGHPNENYARELMELHTLGVDRGYTQEDVVDVARAFTGWGVKGFEFGRQLGEFLFDREAHDTGGKTVLGRFIRPGGGQRDAVIVLDLLARHPNTADFVSRKMLRYMWGYEPSQGMVNRVARTYLDTGGDIREMLRVILRRAWMGTATDKLKRPFHHAVSTLRALGAEIEEPFFLIGQLYAAGHLPFTWEPPDGFPDSEGYWSGFILPRWNLSGDFLRGPVGVNIPALDPAQNPGLTRAVVRGRLNRQLMGGHMSASTKAELRDYFNGLPLNQQSVGEAIGLAVASPDFQLY